MEDKLRIDGHKLNYHPDRIMPWVKGKDIYPVYVEIGPTSICNHRCIFCALDYTGYKGKLMDTQVLLNALTEMGKKGVKSIMFGGEGEPTLHKDFSLLVEHAKKNGLDVAITTNGVPFTRKMAESCLPHLSWIKFSIDAGTPETYAKIHGTKAEDFEILMRNIKDCVEIKKMMNLSVKIGTQALLIEENAEEMIVLAERLKRLEQIILL
jgi:MoaA/NifB/PqqE/SkfB family radical SAM enzyme